MAVRGYCATETERVDAVETLGPVAMHPVGGDTINIGRRDRIFQRNLHGCNDPGRHRNLGTTGNVCLSRTPFQ